MKLAFRATHYECDGGAYAICRGRSLGTWRALRWTGTDYEIIADGCLTPAEAMKTCEEEVTRFAQEPANDVEW